MQNGTYLLLRRFYLCFIEQIGWECNEIHASPMIELYMYMKSTIILLLYIKFVFYKNTDFCFSNLRDFVLNINRFFIFLI